MEPVFMILGQSAATAAALAIDGGKAVQEVDYAALRGRLLADKQVLGLDLPKRTLGFVPSKLEGLVIDDPQAELSKGWSVSRASQGFVGDGYVHDGGGRDGKMTAVYRVKLPAAGRYRVRLIYPPHENRATNVPVAIGPSARATVNQRREPEWLGPFDLPETFTVSLSNSGVDGYVVVDSLQVVAAR